MIALSSVKKSVYVAVASVASIATLIGVLPATANAETYKAPITNVKDGVAANDSARVPAVESTIGRGSITVGKEGAVTLPGIVDAAAVLVRISVFSAKSDADITVSGSPALHTAAGQDVSATVLAKVKDGKINVGSSAAVDARIEVLATFASDAKVPGSTVALDAPVTRADTAKKIGADSLGTSPIQLGVVGLGGVPSSDVRAVYVTATIDATQSGTVTFAGQQFAVNAGRTVVSTIVTPDENGNIAVSADKNLGALRVDVRGYVAGVAQNHQYANVQGGYVPVTGTDWQSADATQGTDASVKLPNVDGSLFALALVNAEANGKRSFVDVGKSINGRSSGVLVDKSAGAAAQLEVVEQAGVTSPVSVRGGKVKTNVLLLGDVLGEKPSIRGTVNVSIDSPTENADIDFAKTAGVTLEGKVSADSAVRSVDIYGNGIKIGTAAVRYTANGGTWRFDGAWWNSGFVSYEAKAIARDGATAIAKRTVKVTIPDANVNIIDPKVRVIDAANSPVTAVDDKGLMLNRAPNFTVGNIIVSDVSAGAPQGFLRWVDSIQQNGDTWRVTTHQASLTDAIVQGGTSADQPGIHSYAKLSDPSYIPDDITVLDGPKKSVQLIDDSAKTIEKTGDVQTVAYSDTNSSLNVDSVDAQIRSMPMNTAAASTFAAKSSEESEDKWVKATKYDNKLSRSESIEKKYGLFGSRSSESESGGSIEHGDTKVTRAVDFSAESGEGLEFGDHLEADATLGVKLTVEVNALFGLHIDLVLSPNPWRQISYLKAEAGSSVKGEVSVESSAKLTWNKSIPINKLETGTTFLIPGTVFPVSFSYQTDVTFEPSLSVEGKISWSHSLEVHSQLGAVHQGSKDAIDLQPYANIITEDPEEEPSACTDTGFTGSIGVNPEIGIGVNPKLLIYDAVGPGIKVTPKVGLKVTVAGKLPSNKITASVEVYAALSGALTVDLQVPVIDKTLKHEEFNKLTATAKAGIEQKINIPTCKPGDKPDNSDKPGGNPVPLPKKTITWVDTRTGAAKTVEYDQGTVLEISPVILADQLGMEVDDLKDLYAVSTQKDGTGTVTNLNKTITIESSETLYLQFLKDREVKLAAAASESGYAVTVDGTLWSWGDNSSGQLGDGTTVDHASPRRVPGLSDVIGVAASYGVAYALTSDGTVWSWGLNSEGQLGNGTVDKSGDKPNPRNWSPQKVEGLPTIRQIQSRGGSVFALAEDGTLWVWGSNNSGRLGLENTDFPGAQSTPVRLEQLSDVQWVSAGFYYGFAYDGQGQLWGWGTNGMTQCYPAWEATDYCRTPEKKDYPNFFAPTENLQDIKPLSGPPSSYLLYRDGTVRFDDTTSSNKIDGISGVTHLTYTETPSLSYALQSDGTVWELDASDSDHVDATKIPNLSNVKFIADGWPLLAVTSDGKLWQATQKDEGYTLTQIKFE